MSDRTIAPVRPITRRAAAALSALLLGGTLAVTPAAVPVVRAALASAPTTIAIAAIAPIQFGGTAHITVTVTTGDAAVTDGTLTVTGDTGGPTVAPCAVTDGTCTFAVPDLTAGVWHFTAAYAGVTDLFDATSATGSVTVQKAATRLTIAPETTSGTVGTVFAFRVSVSTGDGREVTTGTVSLSDGSRTLGTCGDLSAACSITTGDLTAATHTLAAKYWPDANHEATSGSAVATVSRIATRITVSVDPTSGTTGDTVTIRVSVSTGDGHPVTTGSVSIVDGVRSLSAACSITTGTCVLARSDLSAGSRNVTASFAASATYEATSGSAALWLRAPQRISFTAPTYLLAGSGTTPQTLTATASSGLPVRLVSTTPAVCTASGLVVTPLTSGTCQLRAEQSGNTSYLAAPNVTRTSTVIVSAIRISYTTSYYVNGQLRLSIPLVVKRGTSVQMRFATTTRAIWGKKVEVYRTISGGTRQRIASVTINASGVATYSFNATYASARYQWKWPGMYAYHDAWAPARTILAI